jgi:hypothetical protein
MKLKELVNFIKNDKIISILMIFVVVLIGTLLYYNLNVKIDANQTQLMAETFTSTTMCEDYGNFLDEYTPELYYKTKSTDPIRYLNKSAITARFNKKKNKPLYYNINWINSIIKRGGFDKLQEDSKKSIVPQGQGVQTDAGFVKNVIRKKLKKEIEQIFNDSNAYTNKNFKTGRMMLNYILNETLYTPNKLPRDQPTTYDHLLLEIARLNITQAEADQRPTLGNEYISNPQLLMTNVYLLVFLIKLDFQRRKRENNITTNKSVPHIINNTRNYIYLNRIYNTIYEGSKTGLLKSGFRNRALDALQSNICYSDGKDEDCQLENKNAVTMPLIYYSPPHEDMDARERKILEMINASSEEIKESEGYIQKFERKRRKIVGDIQSLGKEIQNLKKDLRTARRDKFKKGLARMDKARGKIREKANEIQTIRAKIRAGGYNESMMGDMVIESFDSGERLRELRNRIENNQTEIEDIQKENRKKKYEKEILEIERLKGEIEEKRRNIKRVRQNIQRRTQIIFSDDIESIETKRHTKERKEIKRERLKANLRVFRKKLKGDIKKRRQMKKRLARGKKKSGVSNEPLTAPLEFDKALISEIKNIIVKYKEYLYTAIPNLEANSNTPTSWEKYASGDGIVWCLYANEDKDIVSYDKNIKSYCKSEEEYAEPVNCPPEFRPHTDLNKTPDQERNVAYDGDRRGNLTTDPQVGKFAKYCKAGYSGGKGENYHRDVCHEFGGVFIEGLDHGKGPYRCAIGGEYPISTNGMCGRQGNYQKCTKGNWCSQFGYCGKTAAHVYGLKINKAFDGDELGPKPPKPYQKPKPSNCEPRDWWQKQLRAWKLPYKCK